MIRTVASAVERLLTPDIVTGLYQVGVATALALVVFAVAARAGLAVTREFGVSLVRGFVQVVAMGSLVGVLLTLELVWSGFVLVFMIGGATWISRNRGADLPGVTRASFVAISLGAGLVITTMVAAGVIERRAEALLPVGSSARRVSASAASVQATSERFMSSLRDDGTCILSPNGTGRPRAVAGCPAVDRGVAAVEGTGGSGRISRRRRVRPRPRRRRGRRRRGSAGGRPAR